MSGHTADPTASTEWNAGCDFAMTQLCIFLGVDSAAVTWDAATETVDGDVRAVIGNILRAKFGEDWGPQVQPSNSHADPVRALEEIARQQIGDEIEARDFPDDADYEGAYESLVKRARAALATLTARRVG